MRRSVWIGYDPREQDALNVATASLRRHSPGFENIFAVDLGQLVTHGQYQRATTRDESGRLFDEISGAPMSTQFAISRFFVPLLCRNEHDWAVFMDCDVMLRAPIEELFALADPTKAIQVVQHDHRPTETTKMDGQAQTSYPRKNWSSVMLWNLRHPANTALTLAKLNTWAGRALHGFKWLDDQFIGALPPEWNHLVGVEPENPDAKLVHFTLGIPSMEGYGRCEHSAEWWQYRHPKPHFTQTSMGPCRHPALPN